MARVRVLGITPNRTDHRHRLHQNRGRAYLTRDRPGDVQAREQGTQTLKESRAGGTREPVRLRESVDGCLTMAFAKVVLDDA